MTKQSRVTHTDTAPNGSANIQRSRAAFDTLDDNHTQLWMVKAQQLIGRQGWTYDEFDYAELVYSTAVFLYMTEHLLKPVLGYPHYVVHSQEDDSRFTCASFDTAFSHFKRMSKEHRVGLFHWPSKHEHERLYASEGYAYSKDYGAQS